jgi:hypothetical protein
MHYIMFFEKHGFAVVTGGDNPCDAVEQYYKEVDGWCSPAPEVAAEMPEERFSVTVFGLPPSFDDEAYEWLLDMGSDELVEEVPKLLSQHPDITTTTVNIVYGPYTLSTSEA